MFIRKGSDKIYYLIALLTIMIWSSTFISTKILLSALSPLEILVYRFILAYMIIFTFHPHFHRPESLKTELNILIAGVTGGSLYFMAENYAINFSMPSSVSLLVTTAPLFTIIIARALLKSEKIPPYAIPGGIIAFAGVALVIFNGTFVLKLNPRGDMLALCAALSWGFYSITVKKIESIYSGYYVTRKIFFWTVITALPVFLLTGQKIHIEKLLHPEIALNLFMLSFLASALAYVFWNRTIVRLGASRASTFIYLIPLFTLIESSIILGERFSVFALTGAALILTGVIIASRKNHKQ
ncbi:MAG: DMT family transporter [Spirochaetia bacterium]|nr:DMT family transporter [Spirochaetia bacterium]